MVQDIMQANQVMFRADRRKMKCTCLIRAETSAFMHVVLISIPLASNHAQTCQTHGRFSGGMVVAHSLRSAR